jgi:hypothetical protein
LRVMFDSFLCARIVGWGKVLGPFGLTVRGARDAIVRSKLSRRLMAVGWCTPLLGLSQRPVMLCNSRIVVSIFGRGAHCREAEIPPCYIAVIFCSFQWTRHDAPPQRKTVPTDCPMWVARHKASWTSFCSWPPHHTFASDSFPSYHAFASEPLA